MAFVGSTVRLIVEFRDFDSVLTDPSTNLTLKFYDHRRNQIGSTVTVANSGAPRLSVGKFKYDYVIPSTTSNSIIFEFSATVAGMPSVGRGQLPIRWA